MLFRSKAKAVEIILRGITFSAADALEMGLVDAVVPKGEVLPLSLSFAKSLPAGVHLSDRAACLFKYLKPSHATG